MSTLDYYDPNPRRIALDTASTIRATTTKAELLVIIGHLVTVMRRQTSSDRQGETTMGTR